MDDAVLASIFKTIIIEYPNEGLRQHAIRATIDFFEKKYKNEYESKYNELLKKRRDRVRNDFAADKDADIRLSFSMPETLLMRIEGVLQELVGTGKLPEDEPNFMSNEAIDKYKEDEWLRKEFPKYVIPKLN